MATIDLVVSRFARQGISACMFALCACSFDLEAVDSLESEISGADAEDDADGAPEWPGVVSLGNCSGTMISPVHVLTAGHCGPGSQVFVDSRQRRGWGPAWYREFDVVSTQVLSANVGGGADVQVLLLDHPVRSVGGVGTPGWESPTATIASSVVASEPHTSVGYGLSCPLPGGGFGLRRWIELAGNFTAWTGGQLTMPNTTPCDETYNGPQPGDSGGPLFDSNRDVVGVFSGWLSRDAMGNVDPSGTGTIEWTNVTLPATRTWISSQLALDFDGDGFADTSDPYPSVSNHADSDGDGVPDALDNRPTVANSMQLDPARDGEWVAQVVTVI